MSGATQEWATQEPVDKSVAGDVPFFPLELPKPDRSGIKSTTDHVPSKCIGAAPASRWRLHGNDGREPCDQNARERKAIAKRARRLSPGQSSLVIFVTTDRGEARMTAIATG